MFLAFAHFLVAFFIDILSFKNDLYKTAENGVSQSQVINVLLGDA